MPKDSFSSVGTTSLRDEISRHLRRTLGNAPKHASVYDWRTALSQALRDLVIEPWFASTRETYRTKAKRVHHLSMEFLVGCLIEDVAVNPRLETKLLNDPCTREYFGHWPSHANTLGYEISSNEKDLSFN